MDENMKRWMTFMAVALLIWYGYIFFFQPPAKPQAPQSAQETPTATAVAETPATQEMTSGTLPVGATAPGTASTAPAEEERGEEVVVETKIYRITFTTAGAYPVRWQIIDPAYAKASQLDVEAMQEMKLPPVKAGENLPVEMIPDYKGLGSDREYPLMVVLKESNGDFVKSLNRRVYTVERKTDSGGTQIIKFTSPLTKEGLRLVKTFRFAPDQYLSGAQIQIENPSRQGAQNLSFKDPTRPGLGLVWGPGVGWPFAIGRMMSGSGTFSVAANDNGTVTYADPNWNKARAGETVDKDLTGQLKWGAVDSRFYMAAIIPAPSEPSPLVRAAVKIQNVPADQALWKNMSAPYTAEVYSNGFTLAPGDSKIFDYSLFVGPKKRDLLVQVDKKTGSDLRSIMFHTSWWINRTLANFMLFLLDYLFKATHSYGIAIILVTIIMRLLTQPFTHIGMKHQARVMAEQKRVKPLLDAINEKYKNDPQKRNAEIWKMYKEHGVNPFGMFKGCIWMMVQMPFSWDSSSFLTARLT